VFLFSGAAGMLGLVGLDLEFEGIDFGLIQINDFLIKL
jgi:hypothetical protein